MTYDNLMSKTTRFFTKLFILVALFAIASPTAALAVDYQLRNKEKLSEGTYLSEYDVQIQGDMLPVKKLSVDLNNPHVDIQAMHPGDGFNNRETVREMAAEQDAVAAVNADFFHLNLPAAPFGLHVEQQKILSSPTDNSTWIGFGIDTHKKAHIQNWWFKGSIVVDGQYTHSLYGYNQTYRAGSHIFLYDSTWGEAISSSFFEDPVLQITVEQGFITSVEKSKQTVSIPQNGFTVIADGAGAEFLEKHAGLGDKLEYSLDIEPSMSLDTAVGGHVLLVENGQPVNPERLPPPGSPRGPRTAVGIDAAGEKVNFYTIESTSSTPGITLPELSVFLSRQGMDRALNLDGGGSSTMVARRLGELQPALINQPRFGSMRAVPNAVGIFNRAPKTEPEQLMIQGKNVLLFGAETSYQVSGHDRHYHPLVIDAQKLKWDVTDEAVATIDDGVLKANQPGEVELQVNYQGIKEKKAITVLGGEDIKAVSVKPDTINLLPGESVKMDLEVKTTAGSTFQVSPRSVQWEAELGYVKDNTYYAEEEGIGTVIADIDGHVKEIPVRVGGKRKPFFTFQDWQTVSFRSHPEGQPGSFDIEENLDYVYQGERSGRLAYDFTQVKEGVAIAYGQLGSGEISMGPGVIGVSAYIFGDNSGYWLRAEVFDANGEQRYVDLAENVDWNGWKRVQGAFDPSWPQPLVLRSVYLVQRPEDRGEGRPLKGAVYIDHIEMIEKFDDSDLAHDLLMWIGSNDTLLFGEKHEMSAAPFIDHGHTFVPVRWIGKAFSAEASWSSDPETKSVDKVYLENDNALITLTIGTAEAVYFDKKTDTEKTITLEAKPRIEEGRTYLPLRSIGEELFGAEIGYDTAPKSGRVSRVWLNR